MLSDADKQLFSRQILLAELGLVGQERLCATELALPADADRAVSAVAREYLERAGLRVHAGLAGATTELLPLATQPDVAVLAGEPALEDCAAWLLGSLAAVDAIKRVLEVGRQRRCEPSFVLAAEEVR